MVSIIVITYNEELCIERTLKQLQHLRRESALEIIVADGGSSDRTVEIASKYATVIHAPKGKSNQMNRGAAAASSEVLFFVHADMMIPHGAITQIENRIRQGYDGGGFSNVFDNHNKTIKWLGRIFNLRIWDNDHNDNLIFFGDNGIFVKKQVFQDLNGFKNVPIMEDYDFSYRLKTNFHPARIKEPPLIVSARRHKNAGFIKTRIQWITIKWFYKMGISPYRLARWYGDIR